MPKMTNKAQALLEAHVRFVLSQIDEAALLPWIEKQLDALLLDADKLSLNDVVTRQMIKDTAKTYSSDLELSGAIPELVGDVANAIYDHDIHDETTLSDLLSDDMFEQILDQILSMEDLHEELVHESIANPLYSDMASELIYNGIRGYITSSGLVRKVPGAGAAAKLGKSVLKRTAPKLEANVEENLRLYIGKSISTAIRDSEAFMIERIRDPRNRDMALDVWARVKNTPVAFFRNYISQRDTEEVFVLLYEEWKKLRKTDYYVAMIDAGIDTLFDKYGDISLAALLDELGIDRQIMIIEAMRFAPYVLAAVDKNKLLEPLIRRLLEDFYTSDEALTLLAD